MSSSSEVTLKVDHTRHWKNDSTETDTLLTPESLVSDSVKLICDRISQAFEAYPLRMDASEQVRHATGSIYTGTGGICVILIRIIELMNGWIHKSEDITKSESVRIMCLIKHLSASLLSSESSASSILENMINVRNQITVVCDRYSQRSLELFRLRYGGKLKRVTLIEGLSGALIIRIRSLCLSMEVTGDDHRESAAAEISDDRIRTLKMIEEVIQLMDELIGMHDKVIEQTKDDELLYGKSGFLCSLIMLFENLDWISSVIGMEEEHKLKLKNRVVITMDTLCTVIYEKGIHQARQAEDAVVIDDEQCPLVWRWHDSFYLGSAHGVCGILSTLLHCTLICPDFKFKALTSLLKCVDFSYAHFRYDKADPQSNFASSLRSLKRRPRKDRLVQWCHGSVGFAMLFAQCSQLKIDDSDKYLKWSEQCCRVIWERGLLKKGPGLCHGISGNAYPFLTLFRCTQNDAYFNQALFFCKVLVCDLAQRQTFWDSPDRPHSLFEGGLGVASLLLDTLFGITTSRFPCFEF